MPWKLRILSYEFYVGPYLAFAVVTRAVVSCRFVKLCSIGYYAILFLNCKSQTKSLKVVVLIEDKISLRYKFVKNSAIPGLFFFNFVFSIQLIVHITFADGWIQTADLWCWKRPLYQLRHNHFPIQILWANKKFHKRNKILLASIIRQRSWLINWLIVALRASSKLFNFKIFKYII